MAGTILITGVAGFLGRYVARAFAADGWRVIGVDSGPPENAGLGAAVEYHRMLLPHEAFGDLLALLKPNACVHCAGRASVGLSMSDPAADFRSSTVLTFELLDALRTHAPQCRFLFLSSAAVYGNPVSLPVTEDQPCAPLSPYGYHKRQGELLCEEFARIYGLATASVRIFSAYGPGLRRQVVWDICERALRLGKLELHGTGEESRDFIHAADIARALVVVAAKAPAQGEIYNLATGCETSIRQLAETLLPLLEVNTAPAFNGAASPGDPRNWRADISRLTALGVTPATPLESGLRGVAAWCRAELRS